MIARLLKTIFRSNRRPQVGQVHTLADNRNLSSDQYGSCLKLVEQVQGLYDSAADYREKRALDAELVFAGNEWAGIAPAAGARLRTAYNDINYLRLHAPFAGYHLPILDRLDERRFPDDWGAELVARLGGSIPDDVVELIARRLDARSRLMPLVPEYIDHIRNVPARFVVRVPRMFGEIGIEVDGALVNADVILSQSRINAMLNGGVLDKLASDIARRGRVRVLEVGPGYGALAYALKSVFGDRLEYIGVDLPTSLYYSSLYLSGACDWKACTVLMPGERVPERFNCLFLANYMLAERAEELGPIDLAFNCMSFPEMSAPQVRHYGEVFRRMLRDDGVVFDENAAIKPHHVDSKAILSSIFPVRRPVSSGPLKTKTGVQDVWAIA